MKLHNIRAFELMVNSVIFDNQIQEILDNPGNTLPLTKLLVQGLLPLCGECLTASECKATCQQYDQKYSSGERAVHIRSSPERRDTAPAGLPEWRRLQD